MAVRGLCLVRNPHTARHWREPALKKGTTLKVPIRQDGDPGPLTAALNTAFSRTVSPDRWRTYQRAGGGDDDLALQFYLWNAALGQSFHFPLQAAEIALRNVIHDALTMDYGMEWCFDDRCRGMLHEKQRIAIDKAAARHIKKYGTEAATSNVVASVTFGFWTSLLRREYARSIWDWHTKRAFPHLGDSESIRTVRATAEVVQDLRNRIFHHEPLIGHNLLADYGAIIRLLGWICPRTKNWVKRHTSVPVIIRQRPSRMDA